MRGKSCINVYFARIILFIELVWENTFVQCLRKTNHSCNQRVTWKAITTPFMRKKQDTSDLFAMSSCNYTSLSNFKLKNHTESVHEGKKLHNCLLYHKKFTKIIYLKDRIDSIHEKPKQYECSKSIKYFHIAVTWHSIIRKINPV